MKNLKKLATTLTLTGIIMMGVSSARAGILLGDLTANDESQCSQTSFTGIILSGFTGIILSGFSGIILSGASDSDTGCVVVDNGILMGD